MLRSEELNKDFRVRIKWSLKGIMYTAGGHNLLQGLSQLINAMFYKVHQCIFNQFDMYIFRPCLLATRLYVLLFLPKRLLPGIGLQVTRRPWPVRLSLPRRLLSGLGRTCLTRTRLVPATVTYVQICQVYINRCNCLNMTLSVILIKVIYFGFYSN
jgi:hypothetical protein